MQSKTLDVLHMGLVDYTEALHFQKSRVLSRIENQVNDSILLVEHPPVITLGRRANKEQIHLSETQLHQRNISLVHVERGGLATYHGPGQLVVYPIVKLPKKGLAHFVNALSGALEAVIQSYGLKAERNVLGPGVWVGGAKIASLGLALRKWVTYHGVALNVNVDLQGFSTIVPCGNPSERITSLQNELGYPLDMQEVSGRLVRFMGQFLEMDVANNIPTRRPQWLRLSALHNKAARPVEKLLKNLPLHTVCQEAKCPNKSECFARGTSTFIIMGDVCTRACKYCAVQKGKPLALDVTEPSNVALAVQSLGLQYAVVTSVTRDDLPDGGARHFVATITAIRDKNPNTSVEVLVPDFQGNMQDVQRVCDAKPDMFNHNIETVQRLFTQVRPKADYVTSLRVMEYADGQGLRVKSGIMLGLGESWEEIRQTLCDLYKHGCRYVTIGQYLAPSREHAPIMRYPAPDEFEHWKKVAFAMGFTGVASAPFVRSSYRAEDMLA